MMIVLLVQDAHFEKFEAERLALGERPVQRGLVGQHARQNGILAQEPGLQRGERGADRLAQATANADLVAQRQRIAVPAGHAATAHEAAQYSAARALAMTSVIMPLPVLPDSRCELGPAQGEQPIARSG
jgi:hypothetical protein